MIYVSQGYQHGIGLPIFLKAIASIPSEEKRNFTLFCFKEDFNNVMKTINLPFSTVKNLHLQFISSEQKTSSTKALEQAYLSCKKKDILLTLPTKKNQLYYNGKILSGHTDYFRKQIDQENTISMVFHFKESTLMLLTDHIPLRQVNKKITIPLIRKKLLHTIRGIRHFLFDPQVILFSGINPHCGENGLLGNDDKIIKDFVQENKTLDGVELRGPYSGDSLLYKCNKRTLLVYCYHDQGLAAFKARFGLYGANITLGLPFLRISPDFGTGLDLKNINHAHYGSMLNLLKFARSKNDN